MVELSVIEKGVLDLIPNGSERRTSIREISAILDLDERSIYEIVNSLRRKGVPVCAMRNGRISDRGYFIATTEQERVDGLASYKAQVQDMQQLIDHIEDADLSSWQMNFKKAE